MNKLQAAFISNKIETEININPRKDKFQFNCIVKNEKTWEIVDLAFTGSMMTEEFDVDQQTIIDLYNIATCLENDYFADPYYSTWNLNLKISNTQSLENYSSRYNSPEKICDFIAENRSEIPTSTILDVCKVLGLQFAQTLVKKLGNNNKASELIFKLIFEDIQFVEMLNSIDTTQVDDFTYDKIVKFAQEFSRIYPDNLKEGVVVLNFISKLKPKLQFGKQVNVLAFHQNFTITFEYLGYLNFVHTLNKENPDFKVNVSYMNESSYKIYNTDDFFDNFDIITFGAPNMIEDDFERLMNNDNLIKQLLRFYGNGGSILMLYNHTYNESFDKIIAEKLKFADYENKINAFSNTKISEREHQIFSSPFCIPDDFDVSTLIPRRNGPIRKPISHYYAELERIAYCHFLSLKTKEMEEKIIYNIIIHLYNLSKSYKHAENL